MQKTKTPSAFRCRNTEDEKIPWYHLYLPLSHNNGLRVQTHPTRYNGRTRLAYTETPSANDSRNEFTEFTLPYHTNHGSLRVDLFGYWFLLKRLYVLILAPSFDNVNGFLRKIMR